MVYLFGKFELSILVACQKRSAFATHLLCLRPCVGEEHTVCSTLAKGRGLIWNEWWAAGGAEGSMHVFDVLWKPSKPQWLKHATPPQRSALLSTLEEVICLLLYFFLHLQEPNAVYILKTLPRFHPIQDAYTCNVSFDEAVIVLSNASAPGAVGSVSFDLALGFSFEL